MGVKSKVSTQDLLNAQSKYLGIHKLGAGTQNIIEQGSLYGDTPKNFNPKYLNTKEIDTHPAAHWEGLNGYQHPKGKSEKTLEGYYASLHRKSKNAKQKARKKSRRKVQIQC